MARCSYARWRQDCLQYWRLRPICASGTSRPHHRHGCGRLRLRVAAAVGVVMKQTVDGDAL
jgi:hypothetical protein